MSSPRDKDGDGAPARKKDKSAPDRRARTDQLELPAVREALLRLTGAKLCYGKPIELGGRTVVTVASVRTAGGFGFGKAAGDAEPEGPTGAGGGGAIEARPVGFIEIGPEGARFQAIEDHRLPLGAIAGGAIAGLTLARLLARRRRRRLMPLRPAARLRRSPRAQLPYATTSQGS
jgi:uncharacterized spore protein YtfJ